MRLRTVWCWSVVAMSLVAASCTDGSSPATPTEPTLSVDELIEGADVRFSEVHYHSAGENADEADEFVELVNAGDREVELQGWCIDGVKYCFASATELQPGAFLVIRDGEYEGELSNKGESLRLVDPLEQVREEFAYTDEAPWPESADGGGHSLQRTALLGDATLPESWAAGEPTPGSAFDASAQAALGDVAISEVHYHPGDDNPAAAFIEVYNATSAVIDLDGWCLDGVAFCWNGATPVSAGTTAVVGGMSFGDELSATGQRIRLVDGAGTVHDVARYTDSRQWPAVADGFGPSLHRLLPAESGMAPGNWVAAEPSPGAFTVAAAGDLLPVFEDVEFALSPDPGAAIEIVAQVVDATEVSVGYRVDFGEEVVVPAVVDGGVVTASIPGQVAGALVRFRLIGTGAGGVGTWPRQGDGAFYDGTVVKSEPAEPSPLPRLQLFMPDDVYAEAYATTTLHEDEGFTGVFAFEGRVYDNIKIRVKGNQARRNLKRKWKVMLPAGHEFDAGGRLLAPVDQFDLLPAFTDKSYSREILTADMQALSGGYGQQVFPMRVERNNSFFGLYMYGESLDGDWRDRSGYSNDTVAYKGEKSARLRLTDLTLPQNEFAYIYERYTQRYAADDGDPLLRDLITNLNSLSGDALIAWAYQHIDIPQLVEAIATMRVVQHPEWQHKNYFILYDPQDELWRLQPIDFDLNLGRYYHAPCNAQCDEVVARDWMNYPDGNMLAAVVLKTPIFREMVDRRTRTLADAFLAPGVLEARLAELLSQMEGDAALDRVENGYYGTKQTMAEAQAILLNQFVIPKRQMYLESGRYLPAAQDGTPTITAKIVATDPDGTVSSATLTNAGTVAVDVSGRVFNEIGAVLPAGVVILPGATVTVVFDRVPVGAQALPKLVVRATRVETES